jgi:hypothetical protein
MDKVTQQNASLVEEASAAAASLEEQGASDRGQGRFAERREARRAVTSVPVAKNAPLRPAATVSGITGRRSESPAVSGGGLPDLQNRPTKKGTLRSLFHSLFLIR